MWEIYEHRRIAKHFKSLPKEIQKRYEKFKDIVKFSGPEGLLAIKGFQDEALTGNWHGYRSSRLNHQYRVIYTVDQAHILVTVIRLSAHDYK